MTTKVLKNDQRDIINGPSLAGLMHAQNAIFFGSVRNAHAPLVTFRYKNSLGQEWTMAVEITGVRLEDPEKRTLEGFIVYGRECEGSIHCRSFKASYCTGNRQGTLTFFGFYKGSEFDR